MGPQILHFWVTSVMRTDGPNSCSDCTCNAKLCNGTLHSLAQTQHCSVCNMHVLPKNEKLFTGNLFTDMKSRGAHIFKKSRSYLKILGTRMVMWPKFWTEDTNVMYHHTSLVSWANWCPGFVHSCVKELYCPCCACSVSCYITLMPMLIIIKSLQIKCLQDTAIPTCCERVEGTGEALLSALVKRPSDMEYATLAKPPSLPVAKLVGAWKPMS